MRRVLLLVTGYPSPEFAWAGIFHKSLAEALVRKGLGVTVLAPVPFVPPLFDRVTARWRSYKRIPRRYSVEGVLVERPRYFQPPRADYWYWRHRAFARLAHAVATEQSSEILHAHFAYPSGLAAYQLNCRTGIPWLLTLHGSDVNTFPLRNSLNRRRFCTVMKRAPRIMAVSNALAARAYDLSSRRPTVMPIGINLRPYRDLPPKAVARRLVGLPLDKRIALFIGDLCREKGVDDLIESMRQCVDLDLVCVFVGTGEMMATVRRDSRCLAAGVQPNGRIPLFCAAADVFVLPSLSEGMPTVLIEAGAAGLPVIATHVGGVPELLAEQRGYLVGVRDPQAISHAIRIVLSNPNEAQHRADKLKAYVTEHYDVDRNAEGLAEQYQGLIEVSHFTKHANHAPLGCGRNL